MMISRAGLVIGASIRSVFDRYNVVSDGDLRADTKDLDPTNGDLDPGERPPSEVEGDFTLRYVKYIEECSVSAESSGIQ